MTSAVLPEQATGLKAGHQANVSGLGADEFASLLHRLDPGAHVAVAVSGGADSMALAVLSAAWATLKGRRVTALTVDHGLRPAAAAEAAQVGAWLATHGVAHQVLRWEGDKSAGGIQAAARAARYRLLTEWCRDAGADLLVAHHRDDQSETVLMRLARGSGRAGLAAMTAVGERDGVRVLRPLLGVPKARLIATLAERGQAWIEDPSNSNPRFARTQVRAALRDWSDAPVALASRAHALGLERQGLDSATLALLQIAQLDAWDVCRMPARPAGHDVTQRALAHILCCVGGRDYAPERAALARMLAWLASGAGGRRTLHRCVVTKRADGWVIQRELRDLPRLAVPIGRTLSWDGRYAMCLERGDPLVRYEVAAVSAAQWPALRRHLAVVVGRDTALSLPALFGDGRLLAVPQLGISEGSSTLRVSRLPGRTLAFRPFAVVSPPG
jgi:tRNA(Ile)-lysidine synthase